MTSAKSKFLVRSMTESLASMGSLTDRPCRFSA
jgi:hypothetical protein